MVLLFLARQRVGQFGLVHRGVTLDPGLLRALLQIGLAVALDVHAAVGLALTAPLGGRRLLGPLVGRAGVVLRLPVVALLLGDVLHRSPRGAVGALLVAVLLVRAVERLLVRALDLGR